MIGVDDVQILVWSMALLLLGRWRGELGYGISLTVMSAEVTAGFTVARQVHGVVTSLAVTAVGIASVSTVHVSLHAGLLTASWLETANTK